MLKHSLSLLVQFYFSNDHSATKCLEKFLLNNNPGGTIFVTKLLLSPWSYFPLDEPSR